MRAKSLFHLAATASFLLFGNCELAAAQDTQLRQLLLSSRWCSFSYNKVSGASHSEVATFTPDGILSVRSNAETYSSGAAGSVAGQSRGSKRYFWKVQSSDLWLSEDRANWQPLGLTASRNSNGSIILKADGKEYSTCR